MPARVRLMSTRMVRLSDCVRGVASRVWDSFCVWIGVGSARWPGGPPPSGVAHEFRLIPVSGVGVVVDEVKIRGKEHPGVTWSRMG